MEITMMCVPAESLDINKYRNVLSLNIPDVLQSLNERLCTGLIDMSQT